ncbi:MAG TPA: hypothetical protein VMV72_07630, partial [Verrucomicrobiae bacterium]|nr:hypothetical protein [Verrucomicrobiae bacterium]
WYNQWIAVFQKFLDKYPASDKKPAVQHYIELCQAESQNVAAGKVKFGDKWMTPKEKKVQVAQAAIESLKAKVADLQRQRTKLTENIGAAQGSLAGAQQKLSTLQDVQVPVYQTTTSSIYQKRHTEGPSQTQSSYVTGYQTVPNPERPKVLSQIQMYQQQIGQGQATLASLDATIAGVQQAQMPAAEQAYQVALAELRQAPPPVVAKVEEQPAPPPPPPPQEAPAPPPQAAAPVAPAPQPSWLARNWYWVVIGGLGLLILAGLLAMPMLKRRTAEAEALEEQRNQQRRFMYEQLRKVFDRIFAEGQRPRGKNKPEGEVIALGRGDDGLGGGRWFVIGPEYIWAVSNNGGEHDNWSLNNVETDGHGAIGAFVAADEELVETVRTLAGKAK